MIFSRRFRQREIGQKIHLGERWLGTGHPVYPVCTLCAHFRVLPDFRVVEVLHLVVPRRNMKVNSFSTRTISHAVHVEYVHILPYSKSFCNERLVSIRHPYALRDIGRVIILRTVITRFAHRVLCLIKKSNKILTFFYNFANIEIAVI